MQEIEREIDSADTYVSELETLTLLSGENDGLNAIMTINPGAGGTESQDWTERPPRMHPPWDAGTGRAARVPRTPPGEAAGGTETACRQGARTGTDVRVALGPGADQIRRARPADRVPAGHVTGRTRFGDWEGDLVVGQMSKSAVATLVDRRSRYLRLIHLPGGHRADQLVTALEAALGTMSAGKRLTLTWDQGSETAHHDQVARWFSQGVFFANPASSWMCGTNENTNGLLRQYLPKGTDLQVHSALDLAVIETKLNTRPRKILGWKTPAEVFGLAM